MATTTNFGWETPDDTDLVKDGALAMRTLGNAIDASLVDLKGGTTGQVLSKTSNTDMDFTWITSDDANAIQNAIVDAKGDLITATAADTPARLAVGSNGDTLVADSAASTGLRWQASQAAGRNYIINGGMDVWQRNTSVAGGNNSTTFTADRFLAYRGVAGSTFSRQVTNDTTNLPFIQYCLRIARDSGNTSTSVINLASNLETVNSIPLAGRTVTLSYYARAGANFSGTLDFVRMRSGTGTDQNLFVNYTGVATVASSTPTLTTTWQRFSATGTVSASATELALELQWTPSGTAGANDYLEITGIQLEIGSVPTTFTRSGGTLQGELAACQRYYYRVTNDAFSKFCLGFNRSTTLMSAINPHPVTMRTAPTFSSSAASSFYAALGTAGAIGSSIASGDMTFTNGEILLTTSGLTANAASELGAQTSPAFIEFSSEL